MAAGRDPVALLPPHYGLAALTAATPNHREKPLGPEDNPFISDSQWMELNKLLASSRLTVLILVSELPYLFKPHDGLDRAQREHKVQTRLLASPSVCGCEQD